MVTLFVIKVVDSEWMLQVLTKKNESGLSRVAGSADILMRTAEIGRMPRTSGNTAYAKSLLFSIFLPPTKLHSFCCTRPISGEGVGCLVLFHNEKQFG